MRIRLLGPGDIDRGAYDRCVLGASNGVIYGMSWYLDIVAPGWQLLATDDYSFVMPLPWKKKFGIPYAVQPLLCQQLGLFSPEAISESCLRAFIKKIPALYCILQLNAGNVFHQKELRPNYVLDIRPKYEDIRSRYHANTQVGLKKAAQARLVADCGGDYSAVLELLRNQSPHYKGRAMDVMRGLADQACANGGLSACCVYDAAASEALAGVLFFRWNRRFYYLATVSTAQGKAVGAMRFLIDRFVAEFAGRDYWIDFEGSAIPSVAQFYRNFGAVAEWYPMYRSVAARLFPV